MQRWSLSLCICANGSATGKVVVGGGGGVTVDCSSRMFANELLDGTLVALPSQKGLLAFLVATHPFIKLPKQQCRETECYPVPFLPLLFTGGLVQSSSSFSFSLFAPPTARLYGNEGSEITAKHSGNGRASGEITTPSPPPTHHLRLVWPNKGALCWREALSLACFCSRPL